jgi:DnaJ-class molecular chaperone
MKNLSQLDAYQILNLPWDASEEAIRAAYHQKMIASQEQDLQQIKNAYDLIKNAKARERYRWNSFHSYFCKPQEEAFDLEQVIQEIAFLTDWELEEISGP